MTYQEINPEMWQFATDGDFIEGVLIRKQSDVGSNNSKMYSIETSEGIKNVWGSAGLGKANPGHNAPKIFKLEVDAE